MIKAILQNGLICPLEPLPPEWGNGHKLVVDENTSETEQDLDKWYEELEALGGAVYEPGEREKIQAFLAEADMQAKQIVKKQMGLL